MIHVLGKFALFSFIQVTNQDFLKYISPKCFFIFKSKLHEIFHRLLEADVVPLVDIIWQWQLLTHLGKLSNCVSSTLLVNSIIVVKREVGQHNTLPISLPTYQLLPALIGTSNNILSKLFVLRLSIKCKFICWLSIRHLVDFKPFHSCFEKSWHNLVNIVDIIQIVSKRIIDINSNQLPVSFPLVNHSEDTQHFHLDHSAPLVDGLTNLTNINGIIVTLAVGGGVGMVWILPCMRDGTVVPDIPVVREAVSHIPKFALLDILLDRVQGRLQINFHLGIGPARNLYHHVVDAWTSKHGDVVHGRYRLARPILDKHSVVNRVPGPSFLHSVLRHVGWFVVKKWSLLEVNQAIL